MLTNVLSFITCIIGVLLFLLGLLLDLGLFMPDLKLEEKKYKKTRDKSRTLMLDGIGIMLLGLCIKFVF